MKLKLNNRDKHIKDMLDWIVKTDMLFNITNKTSLVVTDYATHLTRKKCKLKYGKVDPSCSYYKRQLEKQKVFSIMTLNILCKKHSIPNNIGYVYIVSNPAWDGWFKVGAAKDAETRLLSYQTGTPFRDYKLEWYLPCSDYKKREEEFHTHSEFSHEWVQLSIADIKQMLGSSTCG